MQTGHVSIPEDIFMGLVIFSGKHYLPWFLWLGMTVWQCLGPWCLHWVTAMLFKINKPDMLSLASKPDCVQNSSWDGIEFSIGWLHIRRCLSIRCSIWLQRAGVIVSWQSPREGKRKSFGSKLWFWFRRSPTIHCFMIDPKGRKKELSCLNFDFGSDILYLSL